MSTQRPLIHSHSFVGGLLITCLLSTVACADTITAAVFNSDDLVIPVFDSDLGTLNSVSLSIVLRSGTTAPGGSHDHATFPAFSSNVIETAAVAPFSQFQVSTDASGMSPHFALTPLYSGGGLTIGPFILGVAPAGGHAHTATVSFAGMQQVGLNAFLMVANVDTSTDFGHQHSYFTSVTGLSVSGANVAPFLAPSNIVIPAGPFTTGPDSNGHTHFVSFGQTVDTAVGPRTLFWSFNSLQFVGDHTHTIDPRFDVFATFNYDPVPEPTAMAVLVSLAFGSIGWKPRRDRTFRLPSSCFLCIARRARHLR